MCITFELETPLPFEVTSVQNYLPYFFSFFLSHNFIMEFDYTQTNKQVQVMALRLERGGELGGDVAINRRCHATGRWLVVQRGAWKS